jgi:hypothetical protein
LDDLYGGKSMIKLSDASPTKPRLADGALVASRVPDDAATFSAAANALGMIEVAPNQFQHPGDQSWAVLEAGRVERGCRLNHFQSAPARLETLRLYGSEIICAAAKIKDGSPDEVVSQLIGAGFAETNRFFFAHADGSWVAMTPGAQVMRGFTELRFNLAFSPPTYGSVPAEDAPRPTVPTHRDVLSLPMKTPGFADGLLACAMLGVVDPQRLGAQGFVEIEPGFFEHPTDQAWVAFTADATIQYGVGDTRFEYAPRSLWPFRSATPSHAFALSIASPALQSMAYEDVLQNDHALLAAGFTRMSRGFYEHKDGGFFAFTASQTCAGQHRQVFTTMPSPLDMKDAIALQPEFTYYSIAKTGSLRNDATLPDKLIDLGFIATVPGALFNHPDRSWLAVKGEQVFYGIDNALLRHAPAPPPRGDLVRDTSRPPLPDANRWAYWQQNTALGKLPILSGRPEDMAALAATGFVQVDDDWLHVDGSWVNFRMSPPLGWKGYHLGELPYNNVRRDNT